MKKKIIITKKTLIGDLVQKNPKAAEKLVTDFGFHCIGCYMAGSETIEEGALAHGMKKNEITKMIEDLNQI